MSSTVWINRYICNISQPGVIYIIVKPN